MADRYWVNGTGSWSDDNNHWATSSNGSPGDGNLPTSADDVHIDEFSGFGAGGTLTIDMTASCYDFLCTSGHTYTITGATYDIRIYGSILLESGITWGVSYIYKYGNAGANTITTAGVVLENLGVVYGTSVNTLLDDLELNNLLYLQEGTFDANDQNVKANEVYIAPYQASDTINVYMGSGTWELTGGDWIVEYYNDGSVVNIFPESSTIEFSGVVGVPRSFNIYDEVNGGMTFNDLNFSGTGELDFVDGSNTFNDLRTENPPKIMKFADGKTTTVSSFSVNGTNGNLITIDSTGGTLFNLSKTSGEVIVDYLNLKNSSAGGGASWHAGDHSRNSGNNKNWKFLLGEGDEIAYGENNTTQGETEVSWATWSNGAGGTPTITGDPDWGKLTLAFGEEGRSEVFDTGDATEKSFVLEINRYGTGQKTAILQIRGDTVSFNQDDVNPAWETYDILITRTWQYVQVREINS